MPLRSQDSAAGRIFGASHRLSGGALEMESSRRKRGAIGGGRPQNQAARVDGQSLRLRSAAAAVSFGISGLFRDPRWFWPPRGCGGFSSLSWFGSRLGWFWFWSLCGSGGGESTIR